MLYNVSVGLFWFLAALHQFLMGSSWLDRVLASSLFSRRIFIGSHDVFPIFAFVDFWKRTSEILLIK